MGDKWKNPPIFYTVAQLKFNPVLSMAKYVAEIQDRLRRRGFPDFKEDSDSHFKLKIDTGELETHKTSRWSFSDSKRTQAYVLTTETVAFHTTNYENFDAFSAHVVAGLQDVNDVVKLDTLVRVGLRLLDAIADTNTLSVEDALNPALQSGFSRMGGRLLHSYHETVQEIENRHLISKVFIVSKGLPLPPDLHPLPLNLPDRLRGLSGRTATLDNDCSMHEKIDLSSGLKQDVIAGNLRALKDSLNEAFLLATTDRARKEWK